MNNSESPLIYTNNLSHMIPCKIDENNWVGIPQEMVSTPPRGFNFCLSKFRKIAEEGCELSLQ